MPWLIARAIALGVVTFAAYDAGKGSTTNPNRGVPGWAWAIGGAGLAYLAMRK